nr:hypothetical protein [Tanacetum cinerariifolium]
MDSLNYSLWEVIINGDSPIPTIVVDGVVQPVSYKSAEQKLARRNELKARVCAATSVSAVCAKLHVSSHPNIESLSNAIVFLFFASQSTSPQLDNEDLKKINVDDLEEMDLRWQTAMLTMRARRFLQKTCRNLGDNRVTSMGFDMSKVECYNCHRKGHFARECRSPKDLRRSGATEPQRRTAPVENSTSYALVSQCDGIGSYDWSYQAEEEPANFALMAITSSSSSSDNETNDKHGLGYVSSESNFEILSPSSPSDRLQPSGGYHVVPPLITGTFMPPKPDLVFHTAPIDVETNHSAFTVQLSPSKPAQELSHTTRPLAPIIEDLPVMAPILDATLKLTNPKSNSISKRKNRKTCFVCRSVDHLIKDCIYHAKKKAQPTPRNYAHRGYDKQHALFTHKHPPKHMVPVAVLTQSKPVSITTVRPVCAAVPKIMVTRPRHAHSIKTKSKSSIRRHITHSPSPKTSNSPPRVTAAQASLVSAVKGKNGKWGNPQYALKDKGVIDSGCSRHMTGNMSYLSDFEKLNGGYVAFGGNPKGGKISGKGKIKTCKLDFEDVYFVKELKFHLFSVSQMCDNKNKVLFINTECLVLSPDFKLPDESQVLHRVPRENNMYNANLKNIVPSGDLTCLFAKATIDESNLWHRRLGYINFKNINKLVKGNLVRGLPIKVFENNNTCIACKKGKQHRASYKTKPVSSVDRPLFRLYMDLFGPIFVKSLNKKSYCLVITDDYSRFTWVFFLATKDETSLILKTFITGLENQLSLKVKVLVTKPHNKTPYELLHGRIPSIGFMRPFGYLVAILNTLDPLDKFEGKVDEGFLVGYSVNSKAFRVFNSRTCIVQKTLHVNFLENKPNIIGSGPTWLFDINSLTRTMNYQPDTARNQSNLSAGFQDKFEEEINQQYVLFPMWSFGSTNPKNNDKDAAFDEKEHDPKKPEYEVNVSLSSSAQSGEQDDNTKKKAKEKSPIESFTGNRDLSAVFEDHSDNSSNDVNVAEADFNNLETSITSSPIPTTRNHKDHLISQIIGDLSSTTQIRSMSRVITDQGGLSQIFNDDLYTCMFSCFLSQEEPKRILVDLPHGKRAIGNKWVYRNKKDERGIVVRNKARLVTQGHTQEEGIDYEEVFALVARIEAIRLFLAYASFMGFMVCQMDVKSAFLYGTIDEEVYVCQPLGFEDPDHPDKVYKVVKALYGLHQAPRTCYETLANYLLENGFHRGKIDQTLFIKKQKGDILLVQIYVKQKKDGIFISQDKYVAEILKKFGLTEGKSASTPIDTEKPLLKDPDVKRIFRYLKGKPHLGLWYPKDSPFDLVAYSDSDYAGASLDRKSTTGGCQFLGCRLISWQCKKQTVVATSSIEAEYVATASCCAQVLWIQNQLLDYGLVRNIDSSSKFYMYPRFIQLIIQNQLGENVEEDIAEERVQDDAVVAAVQEGVTAAVVEDVQEPSIPSPTLPPQPPQDIPSTS